jgi:hypothetical protein
MAGAYLAFSEANKSYFDVINYFLSAPEVLFTPNLKAQVDQHGNKILAYVEQTLAEGTGEGSFKSVDPRRYALILWALLHGLIQFKKLQHTVLKGQNHQQMVGYAIDQFIGNLKLK